MNGKTESINELDIIYDDIGKYTREFHTSTEKSNSELSPYKQILWKLS